MASMQHHPRPPANLRAAALLVAALIVVPCGHPAAAVNQGVVIAADTAGLPTGTVSVPITLGLAAGTAAATLGMTLSVAAMNGAPALRRPVSFAAAAGLPSPDMVANQGNDTIRIEWSTPWVPSRTDTLQLGVLTVRLPATAPGQVYAVEVSALSATSDGSTALLLVGVNGRIGRCSLVFSGQVSDAVTTAAVAGAMVCVDAGSTCVSTDAHGLYGELCYSGESAAGTYVCVSAAGYTQSCQGPWIPGGAAIEADFQLPPAGTVVVTPTLPPPATPVPCVGDCDSDGTVDITELTRGVDINLGALPPAACPAFDCTSRCAPGPQPLPPASITCLMRAVNNALTACPPVPCSADADCDDGNPCSSDLCTPDGCTHTCVCR